MNHMEDLGVGVGACLRYSVLNTLTFSQLNISQLKGAERMIIFLTIFFTKKKIHSKTKINTGKAMPKAYIFLLFNIGLRT